MDLTFDIYDFVNNKVTIEGYTIYIIDKTYQVIISNGINRIEFNDYN